MQAQPTRILITGAHGLLGQALQESLSATQSPGSLVALGRDQLDISDYSSILCALNSHQPHILINCAAFTQVDAAEHQPAAAYQVNAFAPGLLAHACRLRGIWLIHISTDFVFDGKRGDYRETDEPRPINVYGASKLAGEQAIARLCRTSSIIRTAWLFGKGAHNFVAKIAAQLQRQAPCEVVDYQYGSPTAATHLAHAIGKLISATATPTDFTLLHFAGAPSVSRYQWADAIYQNLQAQAPNQMFTRPTPSQRIFPGAPRPANSSLNSDKLATLIKLPASDWREATCELIESHLHHASHQ